MFLATVNRSVVFSNATINKDRMTIYEEQKDSIQSYSIPKLLDDWDNIPGITITIKQKDELPSEE